jgi:hypothetical protein
MKLKSYWYYCHSSDENYKVENELDEFVHYYIPEARDSEERMDFYRKLEKIIDIIKKDKG